jgi:hypothetical protein
LPLHSKGGDDDMDRAAAAVDVSGVSLQTQELRNAARFVTAVALAHAAAEGLAMGAAISSAVGGGRPLVRALGPGLPVGAARGAFYALSVVGISRTESSGIATAAWAALAQQARVGCHGGIALRCVPARSLTCVHCGPQAASVAAMAGPSEWADANGFVDRANSLAVRGCATATLASHHAG